jgi:hypothetical protein
MMTLLLRDITVGDVRLQVICRQSLGLTVATELRTIGPGPALGQPTGASSRHARSGTPDRADGKGKEAVHLGGSRAFVEELQGLSLAL